MTECDKEHVSRVRCRCGSERVALRYEVTLDYTRPAPSRPMTRSQMVDALGHGDGYVRAIRPLQFICRGCCARWDAPPALAHAWSEVLP